MGIIPGFYRDSVLALGKNDNNGKRIWVGTGFLVGKEDKNNSDFIYIYIITNKHVVENEDKLFVRFNSVDGTRADDLTLNLHDIKGEWAFSSHPNQDVDIVAIMIPAKVIIDKKLSLSWIDLDSQALTLKQMKETGVDEGTLVYSMGFPMNLQDPKAIKAPICRLGCISQISQAFLDDINTSSYLVDAPVYPGNSGGPIISRPELITIGDTPTNISSNLIGVLSGYIPYKEALVSTQTNSIRMIQEENSGLTIVHPVDRIIETVDIEWQRIKDNYPERLAPK